MDMSVLCIAVSKIRRYCSEQGIPHNLQEP